jgi:hypothetical protein
MNRLALFSVLLLLSACASSSSKPAIHNPSLGELALAAGPETSAYCPNAKYGESCLMTEQKAEAYCNALGGHLPSAREFGKWAGEHGAAGILEVSQVEITPKFKVPAGYYKVPCLNPGNIQDDLYFSHQGYNVALGALGNEQLWTSSVVPTKPDYAHVFYGAWGGGGGKPKEHKRSYLNGVRCIM